MERWEFCYVDFIRHEFTSMTSEGLITKRIRRDKSLGDDSKDNATARLIAQLGLEGWDMTNGAWNVGPILFSNGELSPCPRLSSQCYSSLKVIRCSLGAKKTYHSYPMTFIMGSHGGSTVACDANTERSSSGMYFL